jgi:membrane protein implicated in regulation of membrane protease activity
MLGLYLFALILGGGLLVFSALGGDGDSDAHAGGHDGDAGGHHHGGGDLILGFFRPRNLVFLLAAFGATGSMLTLIGRANTTTPLLAAIVGVGAMAASHAVFSYLRRTDSAGSVLDDRDLEGRPARVVLSVAPGERGRVVCLVGGREQYLTARLAPDATDALVAGRDVVILGITDGVARIAPFDTLELPASTSPTE